MNWYFRVFIFLALVFSFLCFYKPYRVPNINTYSLFTRSWGFDHIRLYGLPWQIVFYVLAFLLVLPWSNAYISKFLQSAATTLSSLQKKRLVFIAISVISVGIFYLLREKYFLLGDFNLRLEQIMHKQFLNTEFLTMKLLYYFAIAASKLGLTPYQSFVYYSCLAGGGYIFFCCLIADLTGVTPLQKLFFFLAQVSTALLLVFCGYIEIYATVIVLLNAYVYFGLRYLKLGKGFYLVLLCLALAVAAHLLSLAVIPSTCMLWYFNNKRDFKFIAKLSNSTIGLIIFLVIFAAVIVMVKKSGGLTLPMTAPKNIRNYMTMFSFRHFWESINGQLLACGLSFVFLPFLLIKAMRERFQPDAFTWFLLSISGCLLLVILIVNLHRGSGDWDIMASTAISLNLAAAMVISQLYRTNSSLVHYLLTAIIGLNALNTALWLHVNHTDKSLSKIEMMLGTDPGTYYTRLPNYLQLGLIFEENNLQLDAERMGRKACGDAGNSDTRSCMFYAKKLLVNGRRQQSINKIREVLSGAPYNVEGYFFLMEHYEKTRQRDLFFFYLNQLFDAFRQQSDNFLNDKNYGRPEIYVSLFSQLFREEYPKKNHERLKSIDETVSKLQKLLPPKK